ncbi:hypothetical protein FA15DRAFT_597001 [Coprinopsis marcescibilis]|uniref:P-loop containing nucleoside triphosphate hydrolase protein n=1 Tax=Coprinopsis marcescibilis TaxID=230819 RepID=A0A5C3L155_COPMA|nr:hypothetical protein FA15DRAFT_597001 [Coprinopsis marcescibilis]
MDEPQSESIDAGAGVGLSNASLSSARRQMLDLVNRLVSTGVQVDIDLPQIAVIGAQSAGKSSLIESISGITLPRAAGTCTRCPTECQLSHSNSKWRCDVSLQFNTDSKGQPLGQVRRETFGPTIYDKAEVEDRIRRAQLAVLNPNRASKQFLEGDESELKFDDTLSFSQNFVSLKISGRGVADLSFVDLPGLIASVSTGRGHSNDIALVESLVTTYIKRPSCIILLTVACETDFENQGAHRLTKLHDPQGKRTVGVLTKPDRIPTGEEYNWLPFIRNEREALEHNWYCVKQPSSNDIKNNVTWEEARQRENDFFSSTAPWSELESYYQKHLRTSNLVDRLSSVLSDLISKRLPQIQEELDKSINAVQDAINALPPPPSSNPFNEIVTRMHRFTSDVGKHVLEGMPSNSSKGLFQCIRFDHMKFRKAIRDTAPEFRPYEKRYAGMRQYTEPTFLGHEEEVEVVREETVQEVIFREETVDEVSESEGSKSEEEVNSAYHVAARDEGPFEQPPLTAIFVDQVHSRAQNARTRELPGHVPFVVQKEYIEEIIYKWRLPSIRLLQSVQVHLAKLVKDLVTKHFHGYGAGTLEQRVRTIMHKHLAECIMTAQSRLEWLLELEAHPFTLNSHYLADYKDKFFSFYKAGREREIRGLFSDQIEAYTRRKPVVARAVPAIYSNGRHYLKSEGESKEEPTGVAKVLRGLAEMGMEGVKAEDIPKILPPDEMESAINIMADVRAYFQVSYKRFADNVPLAIDHGLVRGLERDLLSRLHSMLKISGPDGHRICRELSQENTHIADQRADLEKKLERLDRANSELLNVGTSG